MRQEEAVEERQQGEGESASETTENVGGVGGQGLQFSPHYFNMKEGEETDEEEDGGGSEEFISTYRREGWSAVLKFLKCCSGVNWSMCLSQQINSRWKLLKAAEVSFRQFFLIRSFRSTSLSF